MTDVPSTTVDDLLDMYFAVPVADRNQCTWVMDQAAWRRVKDHDGRLWDGPGNPVAILGLPIRFEDGAAIRIEVPATSESHRGEWHARSTDEPWRIRDRVARLLAYHCWDCLRLRD